MSLPDDADARLLSTLSEEARRQADADAAELPRPGAWHRLEQRRARSPRGGVRWWTAGLGLAAVSVAAVVFGLYSWRSGRALTFEVGGGAIVESGYIRGAANAGAPVQFSDGTRIDLAAGARMSVVAPGLHGARLRVDEGTAHFSVMHLPHAAWSVEAGPYVVEVTGTVFDVRWSSADEVVEVRLQSGSVRVSGPMLTEHATLRPGQHLTAHLATRELRIDENGGNAAAPTLSVPPPGASPPPENAASPDAMAPPDVERPAPTPDEARPSAEAPPADVARPGALASAPVPPRAVRKPARKVASVDSHVHADWAPRRWSERVSAGDAKGVVAEAVAHGIDAAVADADAEELVALADAARYAGRTYLAERVLRAQRTRFPGSAAAGAAAFFLGRLADDHGAAADGLEWYRRYLSEVPRGAYAAEALGREMIGVARLSGRPAARELAREYLNRFPDGTYLLHAQAILQSP